MYCIKKSDKKITSLTDSAWETADIAKIDNINWQKFSYKPHATARILYSEYGLHIQLQTDEQPLLARFTAQNSAVCRDSCMELFIRPNEGDRRYLNFEFNAFGTMYLGLRTSREDFTLPDKNREYFEVKSYTDDKKWILQFTIPFEFIGEIFGGYTKNMYGNIYKCGEDTEREHYVTYSPINTPEPDFHRPEFFTGFVLAD